MNKTETTIFKYKMIAEDIEEKIKKGILKKGSLMKSELKTQQEYGVSRVTVRKAFKLLHDKGIIRTVHGVGTFINDLYTRDWTWMNSFSTEVQRAGHKPTTKINKFKIIKSDEKVSKHLEISEKTECYFFERVRYIDNQPIWITRSYIPCDYVADLNPEYFSIAGITQSIFRVLELNFGIKCSKGIELHEAINISKKDAEILNIDNDKPVIMKAFVGYDDKKAIVYENTIMAQSISKMSNYK